MKKPEITPAYTAEDLLKEIEDRLRRCEAPGDFMFWLKTKLATNKRRLKTREQP